MKALFLSHVPPFPNIGGDRLRISQSLRMLADIYDVDIAYITNFRDAKPIKEFLPEIKNEYPFYASRFRRYLRAGKRLINDKTLVENLFFDERLYKFIVKESEKYDLIFCSSPVTAQYVIKAGLQDKSVLDMIDSLTMNYENESKNIRGIRKYIYSQEVRRMRNYESLCRKRIPSIAYISEKDRDYLGLSADNCHIIKNTVKYAGNQNCLNTHPELGDIIFVGKMDYEPNIMAVRFFAENIWDKIYKKYPDRKFRIVGMNPGKRVKNLENLPGVEVTGYVESLQPFFKECSLVVAPMISGSGVQNKILEALSFGCNVLTTPIGLEGIECLSDVLYVVEPKAEEWVDKIEEIFGNKEDNAQKAQHIHHRIKEEFGEDEVRRQFQKFLTLNS